MSYPSRLYETAKAYLNLADQAAADGAVDAAARLREDAAQLNAQGDAIAGLASGASKTPAFPANAPTAMPKVEAAKSPATTTTTRTMSEADRVFEERVFGLRERVRTAQVRHMAMYSFHSPA